MQRRLSLWITVTFACSAMFSDGVASAESTVGNETGGIVLAQASTAPAAGPGSGAAPGAKRKAKKRRKKPGAAAGATSGAEAGADAAATAEGDAVAPSGTVAAPGSVHSAQERMVEPYTWELQLASDFGTTTTTIGDAETASADYSLGLSALRVIGNSFEIGGQVSYSESSSKEGDDTNTDSTYLLSLLAKYNFGNLNEDVVIFYLFGAVGYGGNSTKSGDATSETSIMAFGGGLGMSYFLDSNVALFGQAAYDMRTLTVEDAEEDIKQTNLHFLQLGLSVYL